jgi:ribonuclease VapC
MMFIDASAIVAIVTREPQYQDLAAKLAKTSARLTSALATYEATMALARMVREDFSHASMSVASFVQATRTRHVLIDEAIGNAAVTAFQQFGKGRHKAGLNMGDCFSYACAKVHRVPLLFKGDDFIHTDIQIA